jgi:hypothetical protein
MRTVKRRVLEIGLAARQKGPQGEERKKAAYRRLLSATRKIAHQAERVSNEIAHSRGKVRKLGQQLGEAVTRVRQVIESGPRCQDHFSGAISYGSAGLI